MIRLILSLVCAALALVALSRTAPAGTAEESPTGTAEEIPTGTVKEITVRSPSVDAKIPTSVYLPDAFKPGMPVLYLLHGYGGGHRDWLEAGKVVETADAVFAAPGAKPMAIVMPGVGNSWYVDGGSVGRYGDWRTAFIQDLIPTVEETYGIGGNRNKRFVAGLSMGGFGALHLAVHNPDLFRAAAALSPAIFEDADHASDFPEFQMTFFAGAFGDPFDVARFNRQNVFADLPTLALRLEDRPIDFYIMTGDHDGFGLWRGAVAFFRAARDDGLPAELRVHDGNHEWRLWRDELDDVLRWVASLQD
jgi:enterochelin esterase family protein